MKFKTLFLSMLGAAAIVSCNNDSVIGGGPDGPGGGSEGESTTATFQFNFVNPGTYSGDDDLTGSGRESSISDVGLFIYKLDGTPEAMAYLVATEFTNLSSKITLKCKSGDKLIYLAANIGGTKLIKYADDASNATAILGYVGKDWNPTGGPYGPKFSVSNNSNTTNPLNSAIWSKKVSSVDAIAIDSITGTFSPDNDGYADGLIKALTGGGIPANGVLTGDGTGAANAFYLMSNWGDAATQPGDIVTGTGTGTTYSSTCKFKLIASIPASDSQAASADGTNNNGKNALLINIQRAVAKVAVKEIANSVLIDAGQGTSKGKFTPHPKWAVGNINTSEYPFQMWDGTVVKSTRYDDTARLVNPTYKWDLKMDNRRITGGSKKYSDLNLLVSDIVGTDGVSGSLNQTNNLAFSGATPTAANYILITENNNKQTFNHYTTYVLIAGQYKPDSLIKSVNDVGQVTGNNGQFPTTWPVAAPAPLTGSIDTIYYVGSLGTDGLFFLGLGALQQYVCYVLNVHTGNPPYSPTSDTEVAKHINDLRVATGNKQADLQTYWHGNCFYRIWISDDAASSGANKKLIRRNHAYQVSVTKIKGPGIGDPNDIIDPDPTTIEPIEEADTYVTASINIMNWHVIKQNNEIDINGN
ncbi:MAG: fimbria major subunit [Tannerella sp.]|jgi:hypothetical protein|nr:fimbria major subunit [Tannerella sp.]